MNNQPKVRFTACSLDNLRSLKEAKLSDVVTFLRGTSMSKEDVIAVEDASSNSIPCVLYGHLYTTYAEIASESKFYTNASIEDKQISKVGDVLMPTSDVTPKGLATATCIMFNDAIIGGDINILRPNGDIDGRFLSLAINSHKEKIYPLIVGSTVRHLHAIDLKDLSYVFPPIKEQQKIAAFFSALDKKIELISKRQILFERSKTAFVKDIFDSKVKFINDDGKPFSEWIDADIGSVAEVCGGGTPSTSNDEYWNGDIQWFTPAEINSKYVCESERTISASGLNNSSAKLLPKNTLLLTTRASLGLCSINTLDKPVCTNQGFQSLICKDGVESEFMYYLVTSDRFRKEMLIRASGSTFLEISSKHLKSIKLKMPCLEEQKKIAGFLSTIDKKIENLKQQKEAVIKLKKGLMRRMFV